MEELEKLEEERREVGAENVSEGMHRMRERNRKEHGNSSGRRMIRNRAAVVGPGMVATAVSTLAAIIFLR